MSHRAKSFLDGTGFGRAVRGALLGGLVLAGASAFACGGSGDEGTDGTGGSGASGSGGSAADGGGLGGAAGNAGAGGVAGASGGSGTGSSTGSGGSGASGGSGGSGCVPKSCADKKATCGTVDDECGGTVACGTCPGG